jgi:serine/threonine protein phosphatase PrpC
MPESQRVISSYLTHPGRKRTNNEDYVESFEPTDLIDLQTYGSLYIVADGVGGAAQGERASQYAVKKVLHDYYQPSQLLPEVRLEQALLAANRDIYNYSHREDVSIQMATTMVAALVVRDRLIVASVGDSRAYLIRSNQIQQITRDHSLVGERVRDGTLTEEEALETKIKNQLTRSLGGESEVMVDVFADLTLQPGDRLVLCTDGVTRYALNNDILQLAGSGSPGEVVSRIIDFANRQGGADNITALSFLVEPAGNVAQTSPMRRAVLQRRPVSLDDLETQTPGLPSRKRHPVPPLAGRRSLLKPPGIYYIGGALTLLLAVIFSAAAMSGAGPSPIVTITDTPKPAGSQTALAMTMAFIGKLPENGSNPTNTITPTNLSKTLTGQGTGYPPAQSTRATPATVTPSRTTLPANAKTECVFPVNKGAGFGTLGDIAANFNLDWQVIKESYTSCTQKAGIQEVSSCIGLETIPFLATDTPNIGEKDWIIIPKIAVSTCQEKGGYLYLLP